MTHTNSFLHLPHPPPTFRLSNSSNSLDVYSEAFAAHMDAADPLRHLRQQFCMPRMGDLAREWHFFGVEKEQQTTGVSNR